MPGPKSNYKSFVSVVVLQLLLTSGTATAKKSGGGRSSGSKSKIRTSSGSSSTTTSSSNHQHSTSSKSIANDPYEDYSVGHGYTDRNYFFGTDSDYGRYPYGVYRSTPRFLETSRNDNGDSLLNLEYYFDRVENGCVLTGVNSYRTEDVVDLDWWGCTEEWNYTVAMADDPTITFVSPPFELYACDFHQTCAECASDLRGKNFNALTLEEYQGAFAFDCWVPKDLEGAHQNIECDNEECIFFSSKIDKSLLKTSEDESEAASEPSESNGVEEDDPNTSKSAMVVVFVAVSIFAGMFLAVCCGLCRMRAKLNLPNNDEDRPPVKSISITTTSVSTDLEKAKQQLNPYSTEPPKELKPYVTKASPKKDQDSEPVLQVGASRSFGSISDQSAESSVL